MESLCFKAEIWWHLRTQGNSVKVVLEQFSQEIVIMNHKHEIACYWLRVCYLYRYLICKYAVQLFSLWNPLFLKSRCCQNLLKRFYNL